MAEGTFEYEVMRAELLGIEKPSYDEFVKKMQERAAQEIEDELVDTENLKTVEAQSEDLKGISGKMDELNTLLSLTQKKINNFKFRCSSMTNFMKTRLGGLNQSATVDIPDTENSNGEPHTPKTTPVKENALGATASTPNNQRKSDLSKALDSHVDKLDGLLEKAQYAECSMSEQRKQMKKYLQ